MPEAGVEQMKDRVLLSADIEIDREPVLEEFRIGQLLVVIRIDVTEIIPGRPGPLRHRVGFAGAFHAIHHDVQPRFGRVFERRFAAFARRVLIHFRKDQRQFLFRDPHRLPILQMDDRDRLAPITLTREDPVAEFVINHAFSRVDFF
ncbi:MAG: hypothetical protein BWY98_01311 [Tenericutes bacterium ADurb.BinA155]|nr:MAG: hypothetical protein BWY98_01311 [Tenericutes bacterium ADurb.BinA155]